MATRDQVLIGLNSMCAQFKESPECAQSTDKLRAALHQPDDDTALRMAMGMLLNAAVCHYRIHDHNPTVPAPATKVGWDKDYLRDVTLRLWESVLVNGYWPVFAAAHDLLSMLPGDRHLVGVLTEMWELSEEIAEDEDGQGLIGELWGAMTGDRKRLAAFYTLPNSASLLSELVMGSLDVNWGSKKSVSNLSVADFACGTGELLLSAHRSMVRHSRGKGKVSPRTLIEDSLFGADVLPSSAHLAASRLMGETWNDIPDRTNIWVMPYGQRPLTGGGTELRMGSLDLIVSERPLSLWADDSLVVTGEGERPDTDAFVPDGSQDAVVMNPPYTRATNHKQASGHLDDKKSRDFVFLGGIGVDREAAQAMSRKLSQVWQRLRGDIAGDGAAGLGSYFLDLGTRKLREGGTLGIVLPISVVSGLGWAGARRVLSGSYRKVLIISLSTSSNKHHLSFSADTGMGEVIIIAVGRRDPDPDDPAQVTHCVLRHDEWRDCDDPVALASRIVASDWSKDADLFTPAGHVVGRLTPQPGPLTPRMVVGHPTGVRSLKVQRTAENAVGGHLELPDLTISWPACELGNLGIVGPSSRKLRMHSFDGGTGAFDCRWIEERGTGWRSGERPGLWMHDYTWEGQMEVTPDFHAVPAPTLTSEQAEERIERLWQGWTEQRGNRTVRYAGATRLHLNADWQLSSQPVGACLTPVPAFGGRSWINFQPEGLSCAQVDAEKALCVWLNSTPAMIARWYVSNRQGPRARLTRTATTRIPVLDLHELSEEQIVKLANAYDELRLVPLKPPTGASVGAGRHRINEAVSDALGWPDRAASHLSDVAVEWAVEAVGLDRDHQKSSK